MDDAAAGFLCCVPSGLGQEHHDRREDFSPGSLYPSAEMHQPFDAITKRCSAIVYGSVGSLLSSQERAKLAIQVRIILLYSSRLSEYKKWVFEYKNIKSLFVLTFSARSNRTGKQKWANHGLLSLIRRQ